MSIINRNKGNSERRETIQLQLGAVATGVTGIVGTLPYPSSLDCVQVASFGLSGAPSIQFFVNRFIPGTGFTSFSLASAQVMPDYGVSGVLNLTLGASLPQIGSTLSTLFTNDVLVYLTGVANTAVKGMVISAVIRPLMDSKKHFNIV